jgi:hypothetical protein
MKSLQIMKKIVLLSFLFSGVLFLNSCKKVEGEGGRGKITGKVMVTERLYVQSNLSDSISYPGATEDMYIVYGTGSAIADDKIECGYDGSFEFNYLQPGTYTIYGYNEIFSKGSNIISNDDDHYTLEVVTQTVELKKGQNLDLGTINLIR